VLETAFGQPDPLSLSYSVSHIVLEFESDVHSSSFCQVQQLLQSNVMDIFEEVKGCQHLKSEFLQRTVGQERTWSQNSVSEVRPLKHELLFVEQIHQIAKGVETRASHNNYNFDWFGVGQLKAPPFSQPTTIFVMGPFITA